MPVLDYRSLEGRPGLGARVRAVGTSVRLSLGAVVGLLLVVVPAVILLRLALTGRLTSTGGVLFGAVLMLAGAYVLYDAVRQAGRGERLREFARANHLVLITESPEPGYAGSYFSRDAFVLQGVRTTDTAFVEFGNMTLLESTQASTRGVRVTGATPPMVYLRAALSEPTLPMVVTLNWPYPHAADVDLRHGLFDEHDQLLAQLAVSSDEAGRAAATQVFDPSLVERLEEIGGGFVVEVSEREVVVHGSRALDLSGPQTVRAAVDTIEAVTDRLGQHAGDHRAPAAIAVRPSTPAAATVPTRRHSTGAAVALVLGIGVLAIIGFAVLLSVLDDDAGFRKAATVLVPLLAAGVIALVQRPIRRALRRPEPEERPE